jgi:hypothetical protein
MTTAWLGLDFASIPKSTRAWKLHTMTTTWLLVDFQQTLPDYSRTIAWLHLNFRFYWVSHRTTSNNIQNFLNEWTNLELTPLLSTLSLKFPHVIIQIPLDPPLYSSPLQHFTCTPQSTIFADYKLKIHQCSSNISPKSRFTDSKNFAECAARTCNT